MTDLAITADVISPDKMPIMIPIPIPTKGRKWWKRGKIWFAATRNWTLYETWFYTFPDDDRLPKSLRGRSVHVRGKFRFDGASIPKAFRWFLSPVGLLLLAGLLHDHIYQNRYLNVTGIGRVYFTREEADIIFWIVNLHVNGVVSAAWLSYVMVRMFGWAPWKKHRKRENLEMASTPGNSVG